MIEAVARQRFARAQQAKLSVSSAPCTHPFRTRATVGEVRDNGYGLRYRFEESQCVLCGRSVRRMVVQSERPKPSRGAYERYLAFGAESDDPFWHKAGEPVLMAKKLVASRRWELVR